MEIVFFSKNRQASLFLEKSITKIGHNCTCAYSLSEMIRMIRNKTPELVLSDTRLINLFGFDVDAHLKTFGATFIYYDLYTDFKNQKPIPMAEIFSDIFENYNLFVEIQNYNPSQNYETKLLLTKYKLQNHHILLLQCFFQNPNTNISSQELMALFWTESNFPAKVNQFDSGVIDHQSTLYSYVSQVKRFINDRNMESEILRSGKGFYSLVI